MFSQVCVILFTGGGVSVWGGLCLFSGSLSDRGISVCPGGSLSRVSLSWRPPRTETPDTVNSRRYASYWNAFLFILEWKPKFFFLCRCCCCRFNVTVIKFSTRMHSSRMRTACSLTVSRSIRSEKGYAQLSPRCIPPPFAQFLVTPLHQTI